MVSYISVMYRNVLVSDMTYSTDAVLMPYRIIRDMHNDQLFGCQIGEVTVVTLNSFCSLRMNLVVPVNRLVDYRKIK